MFIMPGVDAYKQLYQNVRAKTYNIPAKNDSIQYLDGGIFPHITPKFSLAARSKVFTVGSCFAREVELVLIDAGFEVPVARFVIPDGELPLPGAHLLNEYNAGTIIQRLESVAGVFDYGDKGIELNDRGVIDLFLHVGSAPVTLTRLRERRLEIARLYQELLSSEVLIVTLGLVESWYDTEFHCYLNRAPSQNLIRSHPGRFEFHRMDLEDVYDRVQRAVSMVLDLGVKKIILTVSPIPVEATFMPDGCVIANGYSKSVLRVCAELVSKRYMEVSYFPSFEIANSFGTAGLREDNVHVEPWVVHHIMHYMLSNFVEESEEA